MPKFDGTGPTRQGSRINRFGPCSGGMRFGWRCCGHGGFREFVSRENKLVALEDEEEMLEKELVAIREEKAFIKDQKK